MTVRIRAALALALLLSLTGVCLSQADEPEAAKPAAAAPAASPGDPTKPVAHDLYFQLKDASPEAKAALIAECRRCLAPHEGVTYFATGILTDDMRGMFTDRDFDVVVHMVFANRDALKTYARSKLHGEFLAKQSSKFKKVRIFDSEIEPYAAAPAK